MRQRRGAESKNEGQVEGYHLYVKRPNFFFLSFFLSKCLHWERQRTSYKNLEMNKSLHCRTGSKEKDFFFYIYKFFQFFPPCSLYDLMRSLGLVRKKKKEGVWRGAEREREKKIFLTNLQVNFLTFGCKRLGKTQQMRKEERKKERVN